MKPDKALFSTDHATAEAASLAKAEQDIAAGRVVAHEEVAEWLKAWADGDRKPMPREWLE